MRDDVQPSSAAMLEVPTGTRTEAGLRHNARVGIQYIEAWLRGMGAVPLYNLMEDAATAEISRSQVWQWLHWGAALDDGRRVTPELVEQMIDRRNGASLPKRSATNACRAAASTKRAISSPGSSSPKSFPNS